MDEATIQKALKQYKKKLEYEAMRRTVPEMKEKHLLASKHYYELHKDEINKRKKDIRTTARLLKQSEIKS